MSFHLANRIGIRGQFLLVLGIPFCGLVFLAMLFTNTLHNEEENLTRLSDDQLARMSKLSILFSSLSTKHSEIISLLVSAKDGLSEEKAYELSSPILDQLNELPNEIGDVAKVLSGKIEDAKIDTLLRELKNYESTAISTMRMITVDLKLAEHHVKEANRSYKRVNELVNEMLLTVNSEVNKGTGFYVEQIRNRIYLFTVTALVIAALSLGVGVSISRQISNPIRELAKFAGNIERVDGHFPRFVHETRQDELGDLFANTNRMLDRLENAIERAESADKAKSAFLANMSHELRTPMHGVLSFARFGQNKIDVATREKLKSYFDEIYSSASGLMTLLNDLLDLSKLEAGKVNYSMRENNLLDIARNVEAELGAFASEKGLEINVDCKTQELIGRFDAEKMTQVLRNIVSNAVKFSTKGNQIRIALGESSNTVVCSVVNKGIGIPEGELESIFDKFAQSSRTKTGAGGTGLGLAICKEIVEQHGGKIRAESDPNGETRFILEIPREAGSPVHRQTAA